MVLSKRERIVAITSVALLAMFVFDRLVLTPVLQRREERALEIEALQAEEEQASLLFARRRQLSSSWRQMLENGLDVGPAEADSRTLHAIRNWSQRSGLTLSSLRPERSVPRGELHEIVFHATGTGRMRAVRGFLERLETSELPVRVAELQIGSRREGTDELSLQVRISALSRKAERKPEPEPPAPPERERPAPTPEPLPEGEPAEPDEAETPEEPPAEPDDPADTAPTENEPAPDEAPEPEPDAAEEEEGPPASGAPAPEAATPATPDDPGAAMPFISNVAVPAVEAVPAEVDTIDETAANEDAYDEEP